MSANLLCGTTGVRKKLGKHSELTSVDDVSDPAVELVCEVVKDTCDNSCVASLQVTRITE